MGCTVTLNTQYFKYHKYNSGYLRYRSGLLSQLSYIRITPVSEYYQISRQNPGNRSPHPPKLPPKMTQKNTPKITPKEDPPLIHTHKAQVHAEINIIRYMKRVKAEFFSSNWVQFSKKKSNANISAPVRDNPSKFSLRDI